ncbi:MAG: hypothetical protein VKI82_04355 [Leptolyngbya sp.]|nr:hypothetical protein [Leptolyngbya sp.]
MEVFWFILCGVVAWIVGTTVDLLPGLGQWLIPSKGLLMVLGLGLVAWLMHDDEPQ